MCRSKREGGNLCNSCLRQDTENGGRKSACLSHMSDTADQNREQCWLAAMMVGLSVFVFSGVREDACTGPEWHRFRICFLGLFTRCTVVC